MHADHRTRALKIDALEALDGRIVPSIAVPMPPMAIRPVAFPHVAVASPMPPAPIRPAALAIAPVAGGASLVNVDQSLNMIYQDYLNYQKAGGHGPFVSSQAIFVPISGTTVGVTVSVRGDFNSTLAKLPGLGLQVGGVSAANRLVSGSLDLSNLARLADDPDVLSVSANTRPILRGAVPIPGPARGFR